MNGILLIVTVIAVLVAAGSLFLAWRTLDRERRRADARLAALLAAAATPPGEAAEQLEVDAPIQSAAPVPAPPDADTLVLPRRAAADGWSEPAVERQEPGAGSEGRPMFGAGSPEPESQAWSRPLAAMGAGAGLLIVVAAAAWLLGGRPAPDEPPPAPVALELLSLAHSRAQGDITISGLVRNPRSSAPVEALSAVVLFFDAQGGFLTSARTPLDFRRLAPGEESPFQVTVAAPPGLGRYRISFRRTEGGVVPHVDRRSTADTGPAEEPQADPASRPASRRAAR